MALNKKLIKSSNKSNEAKVSNETKVSNEPKAASADGCKSGSVSDKAILQMQEVLQTVLKAIAEVTKRVEKLEPETQAAGKRFDEIEERLDKLEELVDELVDEDETDDDEDETDDDEDETDDDDEVTADDLDKLKVVQEFNGLTMDEQKQCLGAVSKALGGGKVKPNDIAKKPDVLLETATQLVENFNVDLEDLLAE